MKIVHLALQAPYNEGWGYQENLLTKYQVKLGHQVTLITTNVENCPGGVCKTVQPCDYKSSDGFRVIRLDYVHYKPAALSRVYRRYKIYALMTELQPDMIMVHGLGSFSSLAVLKYLRKQNPDCKVIADNHCDDNNSPYLRRKKLSTAIYRASLRWLNRAMQKRYKVVFGVTPWRCEFAHELFGIHNEKLDLLPAGADDEKIDFEHRADIADQIRKKHDVDPEDFLIVTGGKIEAKKNIHLLMQAVAELDREAVKLIVFGSANDEMKETVEQLAAYPAIRQIGWIPADETYNYFLAADLIVFPGGHSVMWEQAVACGTPCIFKHFESMHHCDIGGNCRFIYEDSTEALKQMLVQVMEKTTYSSMLEAARSPKSKAFLYSALAEKTIQAARE